MRLKKKITFSAPEKWLFADCLKMSTATRAFGFLCDALLRGQSDEPEGMPRASSDDGADTCRWLC
jgi:hypothetical protein